MLHEHPDFLQSCFQQSLSQAQIGQLAQFMGPEMRLSMQTKVEKYLKIQHAGIPGIPPWQYDAEVDSWEQLKQKYPCVICQDVLAGPVVLNCSHSFCGACCSDMIAAVAPADSCAVEHVSHRCPSCKTEIESVTFERMLDANLLRMVEALPDCEAKIYWKLRRAAQLADKEGFPRRRAVDDEEEEEWDEDWATPYIVFAIIALVAVYRHSK
ncbi:hypothetical protein B484DRAFT_409658 [Ochromonadaceae sp. CCMP2298]|nr:hypothetical protein B484DRAFT_409658 [Ochromonadaceae sp. CCMP2298]